MDHVSYFKYMFESILDYRKIVFLMVSYENDLDFSNKCGFLRNQSNRFSLECKKFLNDQIEDYLDFLMN